MKCPECKKEITEVEVQQRYLSTATLVDGNVILRASEPEWIEDECIQCPLCGMEITSDIDNRLAFNDRSPLSKEE